VREGARISEPLVLDSGFTKEPAVFWGDELMLSSCFLRTVGTFLNWVLRLKGIMFRFIYRVYNKVTGSNPVGCLKSG
jgi:hypothetical protein